MSLESLQQPDVIATINASSDDAAFIASICSNADVFDPCVAPIGHTWELMDDDTWELIPNYS